jgi:hypothetical protein
VPSCRQTQRPQIEHSTERYPASSSSGCGHSHVQAQRPWVRSLASGSDSRHSHCPLHTEDQARQPAGNASCPGETPHSTESPQESAQRARTASRRPHRRPAGFSPTIFGTTRIILLNRGPAHPQARVANHVRLEKVSAGCGASSNPAAVQRILRHSDPRLTTEVYGLVTWRPSVSGERSTFSRSESRRGGRKLRRQTLPETATLVHRWCKPRMLRCPGEIRNRRKP